MTANKGGTALTTPFADFVSKGLFSTLSGVPFSQIYLDFDEMVIVKSDEIASSLRRCI